MKTPLGAVQHKAASTLLKEKIVALIVIGGDGSPVVKDRIVATKLGGCCARHHSWEIKHHDCRAE
jgi:6-phosphofructokinase